MNNNNIDQLKSSIEELRQINNLIEKISQVRETNHIMSLIINELNRITNAEQGVISLVSQDVDNQFSTIVRKRNTENDELPYSVSDIVFGWVLKNKQTLKIDDMDNDSRITGINSENGKFKRLICSPMMVRGNIIGLVNMVRSESQEPFSNEDSRLVSIISSQSAQILSNALLLEELAKKNQILEHAQIELNQENKRLLDQLKEQFSFESIIGKSQAMKNVLSLASKACMSDAPVLITGPTGTGKELIAKAIHFNSQRKSKPFVVKNCGVKTESLLESELFGHVKGSFTGADRSKAGLFKEADTGTIFLDEIGDAPLSTQAAILRVLENGEIRPVGASKHEYVDVRIVSATNRALQDLITEDKFRKDLYYRLNTITIELPPLKHRREDIPLLIDHFLEREKVSKNKPNLKLSEHCYNILCNYDWPGNIRQLEHEIERAAVVCDAFDLIEPADLSPVIIENVTTDAGETSSKGLLREKVESLEKELIMKSLVENKNNILRTSKYLGLTRKGLKDKIIRYNIDIDNLV